MPLLASGGLSHGWGSLWWAVCVRPKTPCQGLTLCSIVELQAGLAAAFCSVSSSAEKLVQRWADLLLLCGQVRIHPSIPGQPHHRDLPETGPKLMRARHVSFEWLSGENRFELQSRDDKVPLVMSFAQGCLIAAV